MKRGLMRMALLSVAFCLAFAGCSAAGAGDGGGDRSAAQSVASGQERAEGARQAAGEEHDMSSNAYTTREAWVQNGDRRIYGIAYVPDGGTKVPLVIFSHELGNDHTSGERYAERLAQAGYGAYVFDFCGGTVGGNKSDGSNKEMSVLTEASDLEAVLEASKSWDFVDANKVFLLGGSMGGLVTTVVGSSHQDEIAGMMLMYPALSAKEDSGALGYGTADDIPEDVSLFGGWIHVGKNYIVDLQSVDFNQLLSSYRGHMLLLHGDKDGTVPISWSEEAMEIIPDCEYHVVKGGGHEFFGQPFEEAMSYILSYVQGQLGGSVQTHEEADASMRMTIGEVPVDVEWEENESVEALRALCQSGPLTIQMSMYGGFEQVGSIGQRLPSSDSQTTTQAGDIVLYSGNQIVVFYGSNSWAYTRLGRIVGNSVSEMTELLGNGDVKISIENGR